MTKGDDTSRSGQSATGEAMNNCGAKDRAPVRLTLTAKLERQLMAVSSSGLNVFFWPKAALLNVRVGLNS